MRRKVVFLDIDGVLAHEASHYKLDPDCVARVDELLAATAAKVVLTSSWRETFGIAETERRLRAAGLRSPVAEGVPSMPLRTRSDEISAYLATVACDRHVILDDVPVAAALRGALVLVDDFVGLSDRDIALARRMLG